MRQATTRAHGSWRGASLAMLLLGALLSGCATKRSVQELLPDWLGGEEAPAPTAGQRSQTRYSAAAGARLHRAPDASSEVVGALALHESVLRDRVQNGFAHVTSKTSGRSGWVSERLLLTALPRATRSPTAAPSGSGSPPPAAADDSAPLAPPDAGEQSPSPAAPPDSGAPEKSVFDPY